MDAQPQTDPKEYADRLEILCRAQAEEIDRLRAVVAKLTGTDDAHSTLRRLYLDEAQNPNTRLRAAQAALNVEKPSLKPQPAPLDLVAEPYEPLSVVVERQRARMIAMHAEDPQFQGLLSPGRGNGQDDDTGS
jgi:hypothetical protein